MNPLERLVQFALDLANTLIRSIFEAIGFGVRRAVNPIEVRRGEADEVLDVRHAVLRQGRPRETAVFDGDGKPTTRHWVAVQTDRVVGVASVMAASSPELPSSPRWQLRGMAVLPELRGAGVGRALVQAIELEVNEPLWCNARTSAVPFYERCGWTTVGEPFDIEPIGPHERMISATPDA